MDELKEYEDVDEMFDDMNKEWKEKHPIQAWIDEVLFKKTSGICDYRVSYFLTHPWTFFSWSWERTVWAWQRVFRGWDDRVVWSIDWYLAETIPLWLMKLKEDKHGIPVSMFRDDDWDEEKCEHIDGADERAGARWDSILDEIISGFEQYEHLQYKSKNDKDYEEMSNEFETGFDLFREYFGALWD